MSNVKIHGVNAPPPGPNAHVCHRDLCSELAFLVYIFDHLKNEKRNFQYARQT